MNITICVVCAILIMVSIIILTSTHHLSPESVSPGIWQASSPQKHSQPQYNEISSIWRKYFFSRNLNLINCCQDKFVLSSFLATAVNFLSH